MGTNESCDCNNYKAREASLDKRGNAFSGQHMPDFSKQDGQARERTEIEQHKTKHID
jgi:hypothetical protein